MSYLRDLKGQLHLLQDQSFQTPLHLSGILPHRILFQRQELPVRGWPQLKNRVFPHPDTDRDYPRIRVSGQVPHPANQPPHRTHRPPLLNINGHLDLYRS
jgi:hypothetical protein